MENEREERVGEAEAEGGEEGGRLHNLMTESNMFLYVESFSLCIFNMMSKFLMKFPLFFLHCRANSLELL